MSSYSKCIAANHLAVWRRVKSDNAHDSTGNPQLNSYVHYKKELWIFWYGEDPNFNELVSSNLQSTNFFFLSLSEQFFNTFFSILDGDSGTWEIGLTYECRTLLFKALHNLIEKSLLTKGYVRLGQWFFQIKSEQSWSGQFVKRFVCFFFA